jgi:hypothetical protein
VLIFSWNQVLAGGGTALMYGGPLVVLLWLWLPFLKLNGQAILPRFMQFLKDYFLVVFPAYFNQMLPGIVFQAIALTFGVAFTMLFTYRNRPDKGYRKI